MSSSAAFEAMQKGLSIPEVVAVQVAGRLRQLLLAEKKLRKHPIEEPALVFDRLLLHSSTHYRRTRQLALEMGAKLCPQFTLTTEGWAARSTEGPNEIHFLSVREGLERLLFSDRSLRQKAAALLNLRDVSRSTYHQLNHFILSRKWPAESRSLRSRSAAISYLALIEALAVARDRELGTELSPEVFSALKFVQLLYGSDRREKSRSISPSQLRGDIRRLLSHGNLGHRSRRQTLSGVPMPLISPIMEHAAENLRKRSMSPARTKRGINSALNADFVTRLPEDSRLAREICRDYLALFRTL